MSTQLKVDSNAKATSSSTNLSSSGKAGNARSTDKVSPKAEAVIHSPVRAESPTLTNRTVDSGDSDNINSGVITPAMLARAFGRPESSLSGDSDLAHQLFMQLVRQDMARSQLESQRESSHEESSEDVESEGSSRTAESTSSATAGSNPRSLTEVFGDENETEAPSSDWDSEPVMFTNAKTGEPGMLQNPKLPFVSIQDARTKPLKPNESMMVTVNDGGPYLTHVRIPIQAAKSAKTPDYVTAILSGKAHTLLQKDRREIYFDMQNKHGAYFGKGALQHLAVCACEKFDRFKKPEISNNFDKLVLEHARSQIFQSGVTQYTMSYVGSGNLFAELTQLVQVLNELGQKSWKGRLTVNLLDPIYLTSMIRNLNPTEDPYNPHHKMAAQALLSFKDLLAQVVPPGVDLELNIFSLTADYLVAAKLDPSLQSDLLVGIDISEGAVSDWTYGKYAPACKKQGMDLLLEVKDVGHEPTALARNFAQKEWQTFTLKGKEASPLKKGVIDPSNHKKVFEADDGKKN